MRGQLTRRLPVVGLALALGLLGALGPHAVALGGGAVPPGRGDGGGSGGPGRAVVLGGGGFTGEAWEIGLLKGLREAGLDLTQAELVIGSSAGAIAAAQLRSGRSLDTFYDALDAAPTVPEALDPDRIDVPYYRETTRLWAGVDTTPALRVEVGARAVAAGHVVPEEEHVQQTAARLGVPDWPRRALLITAVDVLDGTQRRIDRTHGVPIERAVAASSAVPGLRAPIRLGDRRYMDGAVAGQALDAAAGAPLIVAILPVGGAAVDRQAEALRAQGNQVLLVRPDAEAVAAFGPDVLDPARMRGSAEAGLRQAATVAADLQRFWHRPSPSP
jgi:NTE family protein